MPNYQGYAFPYDGSYDGPEKKYPPKASIFKELRRTPLPPKNKKRRMHRIRRFFHGLAPTARNDRWGKPNLSLNSNTF
jgi:hypothetical protein